MRIRFVVWCAMFPSFVDWPEMLGIMAGMYQKDSSALVFVLAVARTMLVWLVMVHLALCSLLASPGPGYAASWPIWTRRTVLFVRRHSWQWHEHNWFYWLRCSSRCFFVVVRPRCSASWPVWTRLTVTQWAGFSCHDAPRAVFLLVILRPQMLVLTAGMDEKECYVSPCR